MVAVDHAQILTVEFANVARDKPDLAMSSASRHGGQDPWVSYPDGNVAHACSLLAARARDSCHGLKRGNLNRDKNHVDRVRGKAH